MKINLNIERLILDGLPIPPEQGHLVQAAVEIELSRLLATHGLAQSLQSGAAFDNLRPTAIQFRPQSSPAQVGRQIAQAVFAGLGPAK